MRERIYIRPFHVEPELPLDVVDSSGELVATVYPLFSAQSNEEDQQSIARVFAAAPDLLKAAKMLEAAEEFWSNCKDCEGDTLPECCEKCFPLFDAARIARRAAIATAEGR